MKVKDLIEEINRGQEEYGKDFLDWSIYTEQISEEDKKEKRTSWQRETDSEGWEYFECAGFWTKFPAKKVFTINVNY